MAAIADLPPSYLNCETTQIRAQFEEILSQVPANHFFSASMMKKLLEKYSEEDLRLIYLDFCELYEKTFKDADKALDYVVTAGGPASGKSTVLERLISSGACPDPSFTHLKRAYIDPDRSCLIHMRQTYQADLFAGKRDPQGAYEHWREASNFLANVYLAVALKEGYAIAHGSTMATPFAKNALIAIKNLYGYQTTLVHLTCNEDVRAASEQQRRLGGVVQCTEKDFKEKQEMFLSLLPDYVTYTDKVLFCYRSRMEDVIWAAKKEGSGTQVYDHNAWKHIEEVHLEAVWASLFSKKFDVN